MTKRGHSPVVISPGRHAGPARSAVGEARPFGRREARALLAGPVPSWALLSCVLLSWTLAGGARAGGAPLDPRVRAATVARLRERARAKKAAAVAYAKAHGIPVRVDDAFGTRELMAVRDGRPLYYTTRNENAAISTAADQVRTVDTAGAGLTVGVWDGGWIRHRHQEFGTRVTVQDFDLPATGDGLWGDYWTNTTMTGRPAMSRVDPVIDFFWDNGNRPWNEDPNQQLQRELVGACPRAARRDLHVLREHPGR